MRMVDGAVSDALKMHPDYITPGKMHDAKRSITKRVTGTFYGLLIQSLAEQSAEGPAALARRANQARRYNVSG